MTVKTVAAGQKEFGVFSATSSIDIEASHNAFDISLASFSQRFSVSAQEATPEGLAFNNDGTKMFIGGKTGNIHEYTLSTGFDVSTASFVHSFSAAAQENDVESLAFNNDGTKMYIIGRSGDDVNEYTLSTAFDVSTASFVHSFSVAAQDSAPLGLAFSNNGTKMFVLGATGNDVNEYTLGTAFDVSTASFVHNFSFSAQDSTVAEITFNHDGSRMFMLGSAGDDVNEYTLSTAFDVSTASFVGNFSVSSQDDSPDGLNFSSDGLKMFITGDDGNDVNEYVINGTFSGSAFASIGSGGSTGADNLGNHVATQNITLGSNYLSGDGSNEGIRIDSSGNVGIGTASPSRLLDVVNSSGAAYLRLKGDATAHSTRAELQLDRTSNARGGGVRIQGSVDAAAEWYAGVPYNGGLASDFYVIGRHATQPEYIANASLIVDSTGNVGIGTTAPTALLSVNGTANKVGGGSWATFSDRRLKTVHGPFVRGLKELLRLKPISYNYNDDNPLGIANGGDHIGFVAQEVEEVIPEAISYTEDGYLMVDNDPIIWTMLNAVKEVHGLCGMSQKQLQELSEKDSEQDRRIASLEAENGQIKAENQDLKSEVSGLKKRLEALERIIKK